jgi:hypothetical protein
VPAMEPGVLSTVLSQLEERGVRYRASVTPIPSAT